MALDLWTTTGWAMTAASLAVAGYQTYRVKRLAKRYREQLLLIIGRANYVSGEHELVDATNRKLDDRILERYLGGWHQAGCDLYLVLVDFYLSQASRFTYEDLRRICNTPLINRRWQERHWRSLIALRPENRGTDAPPELFTNEDSASRYTYWSKHKDETGNIRERLTEPAGAPNPAIEPPSQLNVVGPLLFDRPPSTVAQPVSEQQKQTRCTPPHAAGASPNSPGT